jgi:hypothetical protein
MPLNAAFLTKPGVLSDISGVLGKKISVKDGQKQTLGRKKGDGVSR